MIKQATRRGEEAKTMSVAFFLQPPPSIFCKYKEKPYLKQQNVRKKSLSVHIAHRCAIIMQE